MPSSLAGQKKTEIVKILKMKYPDRFSLFRIRTQSWSLGGLVDITWMDGPAEFEVQKLFKAMQAETIIHICPDRRYSPAFVEKVCQEYCPVLGCDMPIIEVHAGGDAWMDNNYSRPIPYRDIFTQMQSLDERDLPALAYRLHPVSDGLPGYGVNYQIVRAWVVRRRDYSYGRYADLALCRQKSYTSYLLGLFHVRRRINPNWVEVVDSTSIRYMSSLLYLSDEDERWIQSLIMSFKKVAQTGL